MGRSGTASLSRLWRHILLGGFRQAGHRVCRLRLRLNLVSLGRREQDEQGAMCACWSVRVGGHPLLLGAYT